MGLYYHEDVRKLEADLKVAVDLFNELIDDGEIHSVYENKIGYFLTNLKGANHERPE
jgi:hypothetical protein